MSLPVRNLLPFAGRNPNTDGSVPALDGTGASAGHPRACTYQGRLGWALSRAPGVRL